MDSVDGSVPQIVEKDDSAGLCKRDLFKDKDQMGTEIFTLVQSNESHLVPTKQIQTIAS